MALQIQTPSLLLSYPRLSLYPKSLFSVFFAVLGGMSVAKYLSLHSTYYDFGVMLNNFYVISQGELWRLFFGHAQPLMIIWAQMFNILPSDYVPLFILVEQSLLLALPILWLHRAYGPTVSIVYALYFPVWYIGLFDFHMDHLVVPILFGFFLFDRNNKNWFSVAAGIALLFVKDVYALQAIACGIYLLLRKKYLPGIVLVVVAILYFVVIINYLIPYFSASIAASTTDHPFSWLGHSYGGMIYYLITNIHLVLYEIVTNRDKILYLVIVFGALGFISILKPKYLVVAFPILVISMLSSLNNYYAIGNHYTAGLIAPLVIAYAEGLTAAKHVWAQIKLQQRLFIPCLALIIAGVHFYFSPSPFGRLFWTNKVWSYSASAYIKDERDRVIISAISQYIPDDPNLSVSSMNTVNWWRLATRFNYLSFPVGVAEPYAYIDNSSFSLLGFLNSSITGRHYYDKKIIRADFIVLDLRRPLFIADRGCDWQYGKCNNAAIFDKFQEMVSVLKQNYKVIYEYDDFIVMQHL